MIFTLSARLYQIEGVYFQEVSSPDLVFVLTLLCVPSGPRPALVSTSRDQRKRREREEGRVIVTNEEPVLGVMDQSEASWGSVREASSSSSGPGCGWC